MLSPVLSGKESFHDDRTIFAINRRLLRASYAAARLLSESLLVFIHRLRGDQLDPVCLYKLVPDDQSSSLARSKERGRAVLKRIGSVSLDAVA